ncbi:MAG: hypothetical protein IJP23_07245 [Oscillospiraceae bacterium]|nr:hypothetical protein [Oscillospiraceae bacterium]
MKKNDTPKVKIGWGFGPAKKNRDSSLDWPQNPEGGMEKAVLVTNSGCKPLNIEMDVNLLESCGIPTVRRDPGDGSFGKVMLGASGYGTEIYVPESMAADAIAILSGEGIEIEEDEE